MQSIHNLINNKNESKHDITRQINSFIQFIKAIELVEGKAV